MSNRFLSAILLRSMSLIVLDVGGVIYKTTKYTLRNSTYLSNIFNNTDWICDQTEIFIDRDGRLFHYVLEYLRTGTIHASEEIIFRLKPETQFYGLPAMEKEIDNLIKSKQVSVTTEEGIISLDEINRRSNIKIEYSLSPVKPLPVNKHGYNILTTLSCFKKVYKCPRNVLTHTEPYRCRQACEKLGTNKWENEEEKMYLVSRNK